MLKQAPGYLMPVPSLATTWVLIQYKDVILPV